ncbi:MAG: DNA-directed RNA polymerase subunit beta [Rickettsiales bacterium]|jgi:DNA-directed RNA polymerase subunit beta|nr:DNA-directed RNA polymerase subunit beta [Rickettsiales bacterium]
MAVIQKFVKSFGHSFLHQPLPDLVETQYKSFANFLQLDVEPSARKNIGLQNAFKTMFPLRDYNGAAEIEFVEYDLDEPIYNVHECMLRNITYASRMKVKLRMTLWDVNPDDKSKRTLRDIKEQEIFFGEVPLMTERGTFIANGVERVVISQMHRAMGVLFSTTKEAKIAGNPTTYTARIIPERGSWIDFEESKGVIYVRIDRRRKIPSTVMLRCLPTKDDEKKWAADPRRAFVRGMTDEEILGVFYKKIALRNTGKNWIGNMADFDGLEKYRLNYDLTDAKTGKEIAKKGDRLNAKKMEKIGRLNFSVSSDGIVGEYIFDSIKDAGGEVLLRAGTEITEEILNDLDKLNVKEITICSIDNSSIGAHIRNTLIADKTTSREDALVEIYHTIRPGERPTVEAAQNLFAQQGFVDTYYDLSAVGRFKLNKRVGIDSGKRPEDDRLLNKNDILAILKTLANIIDKKDSIDDQDSLSNRRIRSVGELLENQFRIGLSRIERNVREQLSSPNIASLQPQDVINPKPLMALIAEFFGTSQLSQFMDQYNPLAELEHKRCISATGPGGLNRDRAGFDVRDVHPTHYGRLCPINSPEGPNIGLITHMATYARVNPFGFIETPYYKVHKGKITDEIIYLTADEEMNYKIAQGNSSITEHGILRDEFVTAREEGEFEMIPRDEIDLIDVAPRQIISVATGLIPFVENDDGQRALMGSNMQRQAVPLMRVDAPVVGTGIEREVARDSRTVKMAKNAGVVESVDANRIVVKKMNSRNVVSGVDIYNLEKFTRSNADTILHQRPLVKVGDRIAAGDVIADGSSTQGGSLALGKNILIAFVPWRGYNYEDSIVISERISRDDVFTSIKIIEKEFKCKDTQLGPEVFTRDIPNVAEESLKNLDESGIIYVGAHIKQGDILVGRVTPKAETILTSEEALLRNIFGEKALSVKDTSLRVGPSEEGVVIGVNILTRHGVKKDERTMMIELQKIEQINRDRNVEKEIMERGFADQVFQIAGGMVIDGGSGSIKPFIGKKLTAEIMDSLKPSDVKKISIRNKDANEAITELAKEHVAALKRMDDRADSRIEKIRETNSLAAGTLKEVKIYIAHKTKLQPGDKIAGRHGNKGIVSKVVPIEDMPYMEDGTPVDIVLNPLGVPSRMNIGQLLETHLGMAGWELGRHIGETLDDIRAKRATTDDLRNQIGKIYGKDCSQQLSKMTDTDVRVQATLLRDGVSFATPSFDGASSDDIKKMLKLAKLPESGQFKLYDGMTGELFAREVTVGVMYMMKLHHLVDDKIHARSIGPYALVTQQPLSGKAHMGGQRLGEMEVWALEAHGSAHLLREMLTVKSDDITGRIKMYESITSGSNDIQTGTPEAYNVFVRELRGLGLNLTPKAEK